MDYSFPEDPSDPNGVKRILTLDWISRIEKRWPLIELKDINRYKTEYPKPNQRLAVINRPCTQLVPSETKALESLHTTFPALEHLFDKYRGKIAVCGGILTRACLSYNQDMLRLDSYDCDIFFYGCPEDKITPDTLKEYRDILEDCVAIIASKCSGNGKVVSVDRTENVVNVIVKWMALKPGNRNERNEYREYQFILRIYSTLDSIIGGFDLGPCMMTYDGEHIYTTPLGAWSLSKMAMIIDTKRRSKSFEYRFFKYHNELGFAIVLPGLDESCFTERSLNMIEIRKALSDVGAYYCEYDHNVENVFRTTSDVKCSLNNILLIEKHHTYLRIVSNKHPLTFERKRDEDVVSRYTDYGLYKAAHIIQDHPVQISYALACIARSGKKERIFACAILLPTYIEARRTFVKLIDDPGIDVSEEFCQGEMREDLMDVTHVHKDPEIRCIDSIRDSRKYAEFFSEYQTIVHDYRLHCNAELSFANYPPLRSFLDRVVPILTQRVKTNCALWKEEFKGLRWRTVNPGSQHTSSLNPVIEDPRKFYINCYRPFHIGISSDTELAIRLVLKKYKMHSDLKRLMMRVIIWVAMMSP
jgi:hypothetical protein